MHHTRKVLAKKVYKFQFTKGVASTLVNKTKRKVTKQKTFPFSFIEIDNN